MYESSECSITEVKFQVAITTGYCKITMVPLIGTTLSGISTCIGESGDKGATDSWLSVGQLHQYFWLSEDIFVCPRRTDNQNF